MFVSKSLAASCCAALLFAFAGCKSADVQDIEVQTEANPKVMFSSFKTYSWAAAAAVVRDPDREWTPSDLDIGAEIVHLVDRELRGRGMSEVAQSPDMLVVFAVGVDMKSLDIVVDDDDGLSRLKEVPSGGVLLFLVDPETRRAMWVGSATAELSVEPTRELVQKRLDYAITEMFKELPR